MRSTLEFAAKHVVPAVVEDWAKGALNDLPEFGWEPGQLTRF